MLDTTVDILLKKKLLLDGDRIERSEEVEFWEVELCSSFAKRGSLKEVRIISWAVARREPGNSAEAKSPDDTHFVLTEKLTDLSSRL